MKVQFNVSAGDLVKDVVYIIFFSIFGFFFAKFVYDLDKSNHCNQDDFMDWCKAAYVICFSLVVIYLIKFLLRLCDLYYSFASFTYVLESIGFVFVVVSALGLLIKDSESCGDLHTVAMVFYIIVLVAAAIALVFIIIGCIFCRDSMMRHSGYGSQPLQTTSYTVTSQKYTYTQM